jgi:hypothetical protein
MFTIFHAVRVQEHLEVPVLKSNPSEVILLLMAYGCSFKFAASHALSRKASRAMAFFELCDESSSSTVAITDKSSGLQST